MAMFAAMFAEPIEVIQVGDQAWMSGSMMAFFAPDAVGKWIETEAGEIDGADMNLGMDFVDPDAQRMYHGRPCDGADLTPEHLPNHAPGDFSSWVTD